MLTIKFGTDGWRAVMDKEFTFPNVERVAQAFSDYLKGPDGGKSANVAPKVVVGYDWRRDSENFAKAFAEILVGNRIETILSRNACTTPAVSFTLVDQKADAGIMITASHNPPQYNGIKIKSKYGSSADKSTTDAVEALIGKNNVLRAAFDQSDPRVFDFNDKYLQLLKSYVRLDLIRQAPYRVLVDSMHGVGDGHIGRLLKGGKAQVTTLRGERDTTFGGVNPEPIPQNLSLAIEKMKTGEFDLGIVTDGDADRVGAIRPGGEFISPGIILSLIMLHFVEDLKKTGSVVTTISNTGLIYRVAKKLGLKVHETPVGFKYVCEIMRRENVLIGGEESGGIGFQGYLYERDGMLSGLLLLEMMAMRKQSFDEILRGVEKEFGKLYYVRKDLAYPNELKARLFEALSRNDLRTLEGHPVKETKTHDGTKLILEDGSWLLFRLSGTEPILRIYSEATSAPLAESLVNFGKAFAFGLSGKA
ncbi:MAG: phosphoglucomutase/phosphomannomutase family protein [Candidatus Omnitrophica bacterium]|nr:phosphoglucomutase/phosphomannomutase family protein [Candidatus Omnitrophota bacterium]